MFPHGMISLTRRRIMWENSLLGLYNKLIEEGEPICPVAHKYITVHYGLTLDNDGNILVRFVAPKGIPELDAVPCTIKSENRTSNIAPHLLSDNLTYVGNMPEYRERYEAYLKQLEDYLSHVPDDTYASAVYKYVSKGTVLKDIEGLRDDQTPGMNVVFAVYEHGETATDSKWTEYYLSTLPKNGLCLVTGKSAHIPKSYPSFIRNPYDKAKLFISPKEKSLSDRISPNMGMGYETAQNIIHTLQYLFYAKYTNEKADAFYHIADYVDGRSTEEELRNYIKKNYPEKNVDRFFEILNSEE